MQESASFGYWVRRRRKMLDLTQADLAHRTSCSLSMLRKIERDERRPSPQLAELMADHLFVDTEERDLFLQMARGDLIAQVPALFKTATTSGHAAALTRDEALAPFVQRDAELQRLHAWLHSAMDGDGRILFVCGEAGRGKTRLLTEFAHRAVTAHPHLLVAGGRSDVFTGQGDPLLPVRDIFRLLAGDMENTGMRELATPFVAARLAETLTTTIDILLTHGPHLIDTLIPSSALLTRLHSTPNEAHATLSARLQHLRRGRLDEATELRQERLFEEVATILKVLAEKRPLLLIFEDLHWADTSTVALLGYLSSRLRHAPILLVGSYRPEDLLLRSPATGSQPDAGHPLHEVLNESRRLFGENRIDLDRQDPLVDQQFVNALLDESPNRLDAHFRQQLAQLTGGSALFTIELIHDMKARGDLVKDASGYWVVGESLSWAHIPARVEGVIAKRVQRLSGEVREILDLASVQGEIFVAEAIGVARQMEMRRLTQILDGELDRGQHLIRAQGVRLIGAQRISQYAFRHHLFQKYLYERLSTAERMYLHEDSGAALEHLYVGVESSDLSAVQLARHFEQAQLKAKAAHYLRIAGQNAARMIAHEEAVRHLEHGLALLAQSPQEKSARLVFELTIALAHAYWQSGRLVEAHATASQAIEIAQTLQDAQALALAVLAYEYPRWRLNLDAERSQGYLRQALAALGPVDSGLRVRLLVRLARALLAPEDREELYRTVVEAIGMARKLDDPVALFDALQIGAQIDRTPATTNARLSAITEMMAIARSIGDQDRLADALDMLIYDQLELGNIAVVDAAMTEQQHLAQQMKQSFQLHISAVFHTMRAILRGEFVLAERLANEAADLCRQLGIAELDGILGIHMFTIRAEQGRLAEIAPLLELFVRQHSTSAAWRPGLALIYATLGEEERCRAVFEEVAVDDFTLVPNDSIRVAALTYLAEVCAFLGDGQRAEILYAALLPYAGRAVVVGGATACYGAADRYLAMLAAVLSDWQRARRHLEEALSLNQRMEALPWLAHTQHEYAALLLAHGEPTERARAEDLLKTALDAAAGMGMARLRQQITDLQQQTCISEGQFS